MANSVNTEKKRSGLDRIWRASVVSAKGMKAALQETAFRQELIIACVLIPASFYVGQAWYEVALLFISVMLVLIVEMLNSAIEAAVDRIGPEWHALSGKAKDMGSAAVALCLITAAVIWIAALLHRFVFLS
jgi:diacylglycerol kinase (ATP)